MTTRGTQTSASTPSSRDGPSVCFAAPNAPLLRSATTGSFAPGHAAPAVEAEPEVHGPACPTCEIWQQKYQKLRLTLGSQRRWLHEQKELVQGWEQARRAQRHGAALEAQVVALQEALGKAQRDCEAQATRVMELELALKKLEARLRQQAEDGAASLRDAQLPGAAQRDLVHEFEQSQSLILQYLRQKAGAQDPYEEAEARPSARQAEHPHGRRDSFALCGGHCMQYFDQLAAEIDSHRRIAAEYQSTMLQQQKKHTITVKAVNDKYKELKHINSLMQQRISCLVYQLQAMAQTRALTCGPPVDPSGVDRRVPLPRAQPQFNFC